MNKDQRIGGVSPEPIIFITGKACNSALKRPQTNLFPIATDNDQEIVSMVEFEGAIILATKHRVYKLIDDKFQEIKFKKA